MYVEEMKKIAHIDKHSDDFGNFYDKHPRENDTRLIVIFHTLFYVRFLKFTRIANFVRSVEEWLDVYLVNKQFQNTRIQVRNGFDFTKLIFQLVLFVHLLAMFWVYISDMMNHKISSFFVKEWNKY